MSLRPTLTVAVCTRHRPDVLVRCLASLAALELSPDSIVVADQSSPERAGETRSACSDSARYMAVAQLGLGYSRQAVLETTETEIIAFIDDDCVARPGWARAIVETFARHPNAGAVTGGVRPDPSMPLADGVPAWVSDWGGSEKRVFRGPLDPADLGGGLNMAFRVAVLRELGGFDPLLGAGGPLRSAEDADALLRVLAAGHEVVYTPDAIVSHQPPRDREEQERNEHAYAWGLGAWAARRRALGDGWPALFWRKALRRTLTYTIGRAPFDGPRRTRQRILVAWNLVAGRLQGRAIVRRATGRRA